MYEKELERNLKNEIDKIFKEFKGSGDTVAKNDVERILTGYQVLWYYVPSYLRRAMPCCNNQVPSDIVEKTIKEMKTDNDGNITKKNFKKFMTKFMKDNMIEAENDLNELKAMFYEADLDQSGYLSVDELYNLFNTKLEANITRDQLKDLMLNVDLDFNRELDVDEFIQLMTRKPEDREAASHAKATYLRIKESRKLNVTNFIKFLKKFPDHFEESFTTRMYRNKK
jgi:Ca2+-binding EF-hand superfamily protein